MNPLRSTWVWLTDPAHWSGADGIPARLGEHLAYSLVVVVAATALAVPLGLWVGHTGRGRTGVVNTVNVVRAMPTLGLLFAAILVLGPRLPGAVAFEVPAFLVLVALAAPPVLAGTYSGVDSVDPAARDAARGLGMTRWQVLRRVELPCAVPLIWSGIRSASLQVVATATIAATVGVGGLGRFLIDGLGAQDYPQMAGGAVLVATLAMTVEGALAGLQRLAVSPGLRR